MLPSSLTIHEDCMHNYRSQLLYLINPLSFPKVSHSKTPSPEPSSIQTENTPSFDYAPLCGSGSPWDFPFTFVSLLCDFAHIFLCWNFPSTAYLSGKILAFTVVTSKCQLFHNVPPPAIPTSKIKRHFCSHGTWLIVLA